MLKFTVVPVMPLALSEAMKAAISAVSPSVIRRRGCVLPASSFWNASQVVLAGLPDIRIGATT